MRLRNYGKSLPERIKPPEIPAKLKHLLSENIAWRPISSLHAYPDNPRQHPIKQIKALAGSLMEWGWVRPIVIDEFATILFGHGCLAAAKLLCLDQVPTLTLTGLSSEQKRALVIADNRLNELSIWDFDLLKGHFEHLIDIDFDVELTGFSMGAIDLLIEGTSADQKPDPRDDLSEIVSVENAITAKGDLWTLGRHRLICADARDANTFHALMGSDLAKMVVTDAPYNVTIQRHARGRSRKKHREFAMASGEMSSAQFVGFLETVMGRAIQFSSNGSIHYWFIDWRHIPEMTRASAQQYTEWKNLLVWCKSNAGQGAFYRSQHELIYVCKSGSAPHINNFGLGAEGRHRSNVLNYSGGATPDATRQEELAMHPTVKPVALIADLMRDCSKRNGLVLDLFGGSGTAILAAEETGRCAKLIEIDPLYVDLTIRRWQRQTGGHAVHAKSGKTFDEIVRESGHV